MSLGYGCVCRKFDEDNAFVIYEYFSYNLNEIKFKNDEKVFDGFITIRKHSLINPELRGKFRKMSNGRRRKFIKKVFRDIPIDELIISGDVQIENCSHTWKTIMMDIDFMAYRICKEIFLKYQQDGELPEKCSINF